ncbi:MAG: methyltransferase 11 protein [Patescibacteria group bacterium]|nr:methyltransferase 11 protein [Patescibacteria group bacterium]
MRQKFINYLIDPISSKKFEVNIFEESSGHISSGIIFNDESWYPIINGIPRILVKELKTNLLQSHYEFYKKFKEKMSEKVSKDWKGEIDKIQNLNKFLDHQKKTAESFAYEWNNIYKENDFEKNNFLHFLSPFIKEEDLKGRMTLDIGCGSGRFTKQAALCGTKISFGTDLGESVELAYKLTKNLENICIVQADIYSMPFKNQFDIAYSIGVLHHLPRPQEGFSLLSKVLKPEGKMLIWVYNRRNNKRALYFYEPLRSVFKGIPQPLLYKLCYIPGGIVHLLNYSTHFCNFIGAEKLAKKMPFAYYANFPFNMKLNDAFDVLATPKSNYYYREQIEKWFSDANLREIKAFEHPEAGITCVGEK